MCASLIRTIRKGKSIYNTQYTYYLYVSCEISIIQFYSTYFTYDLRIFKIRIGNRYLHYINTCVGTYLLKSYFNPRTIVIVSIMASESTESVFLGTRGGGVAKNMEDSDSDSDYINF